MKRMLVAVLVALTLALIFAPVSMAGGTADAPTSEDILEASKFFRGLFTSMQGIVFVIFSVLALIAFVVALMSSNAGVWAACVTCFVIAFFIGSGLEKGLTATGVAWGATPAAIVETLRVSPALLDTPIVLED